MPFRSKYRARIVFGSIMLVVLMVTLYLYINIIPTVSFTVSWSRTAPNQLEEQPDFRSCDEYSSNESLSSIKQSHNLMSVKTKATKAPRWPVSRGNLLNVAQADHIGGTQNLEPDILKFNIRCQRWAIIAPHDSEWASEAVRRQVRMNDWCLIIVFDREPSETYNTRWFAGEGGNTVVTILTPKNSRLIPSIRDSEFVKAITEWDYIGRKNIGYYYAITHGAKTIWDFDDNNMLKFWIPGAAPPGAPSLDAAIPLTKNVDVLESQGRECSTWNPYPALGTPSVPSWPRGLPLDDAMDSKCSSSDLKPSTIANTSIAVLQSLSDRQPDADDLYQAIMPLPLYFKKRDMKTVLVPTYTFTPYNARATLHFEAAFWALYLPTSMDLELSDVWRSYIGQRLFWETDLRVGFIGRPLVVQDQSIPGPLSLDKVAIKGTYSRIRKLIIFLGMWRGTENTLDKHIEELWYALEQENLVDHDDVKMIQLWLRSLAKAGYRFPSMFSLNSIPGPRYTTYDNEVLNSSLSMIFAHYDFQTKCWYTVKKNMAEYSDTTCHFAHLKSFTFWTSDIHFATQLDQPSFLGSLGHKVYIARGMRFNRNPFVWKMKGMHLYDRLSDVIKKQFDRVGSQNNDITEKMLTDNFEFYKNDTVIASVDAFVCLYQPGMCEMWMPFNKTIVFIPAHRYNMGRCTIERTKRLNEHLHMLAKADNPKHVISASSKYDLEYLRHYTGLEVLPLYSYCPYVTNNTYSPTRDEIPIFVRRAGYNNWDDRFVTDIKRFKIVESEKLYELYTFSDLVRHRAIVFLPYAVMTYKLTEFYTLGIPLFIPSMKYFLNIKPFGPDRTILSNIFCGGRGTLKDKQMAPHPHSIHPYSPNAMDKESEFYWLQLADFFQWPHITYFDDFQDLEEKLLTADFDKIHKLMVEENKRKRRELENNWCKVFKKIEKGRKVPQDYSTAIRDFYGVSRLQVD